MFDSDANIGYFKTGLYLLNSSGVVGNNVTVGSYAKDKVSYNDPSSVAIDILNNKSDHYMIRTLSLTSVYIHRYHRGIRCRKTNSPSNIESIYISQGEILATKGIDLEAGHANYFSGFHMDTRDYGIRLMPGAATTRIIGCDIRGGRNEDAADVEGDYLLELRCPQVTVSGCTLMANFNKKGCIITGGTGTNAENISITGNHIAGNGSPSHYAINCDNESQNVTFGGNVLSEFGGNESPFTNDAGSEFFVYGQRQGNSFYSNIDSADLLARIATLEADHATMMNNNSGGSY